MVFTNIGAAEVTKHAGDAFLATKISFIDEIADLREKVGADTHDVTRSIGRDGRIGRRLLHPGSGFRRFVLSKTMLALAYTRVAPAYRGLLLDNVADAVSISAGTYELPPSRP
jgi:UDPglucose 6-dehydrogenase